MSIVSANRVREACSASGLLNLTLLGAISGFATFTRKIQVDSLVPYVLLDGNGVEWEAGFATLTSATELARTQITDSSQTETRVNTDEPGTPIKISLSNNQHEVFIGAHTNTVFQVDENGDLVDPSPVRRAVFVETVAAMTALPGLEDDESVFVKGAVSANDGKGGVFYWDAADAGAEDGVDSFEHDTEPSGLFKRVRADVQGLFNAGLAEIDAAIADTPTTGGGALKLFFRKKTSAATAYARWLADYVSASVGRVRLGIRYAQSAAEKFFLDVYSTGDNLDRLEINEPVVLPTRANANGLQTRALSFLSGVSRLALAASSAATGAAAQYREIPLTTGGFLTAVAPRITELRAIDAAALVVNNDYALVLSNAVVGDCTPFYVAWNSSSSAAHNGYTVFRPTAGAAASGNGRWVRIDSDPNIAFANSDATPSIANGSYFTCAATVVDITDFDDAYEGQFFVTARGGADQIIVHNPALIDCRGANLTLTATKPYAFWCHRNGIHRLIAHGGIGDLQAANNLSELADVAAARRNLRLEADLRRHTIMAQTGFPSTSAPSGFTNAGWTFSNGAVAPATGGWDKVVYHDAPSYCLHRKLRARFTVANLSAHFGIVARSGSLVPCGVAATIDIPNGLLKLYSHADDTTGTLLTSVAIGFSLVTGRTYLLELTTSFDGMVLTLLDEKTGQSKSLPYASIGYGQGRPGIIFIAGSGASGNVTCNFFEHAIGVGASPYAVVFGDSNLLGATSAGSPAGVTLSWAAQLDKQRNKGDILWSPQYAGTVASLRGLHEEVDLWSFSPRYVVLALGSNDIVGTSQATWRTDVQTLKTKLDAKGVKLVLMTIPPKNPSVAAIQTWNQDIRTGYFGYDVRYIETAYPLSSVASYDGTTLDAAADAGDGLHLSQAGQNTVYQCVLSDAPYLVSDGHEPRPQLLAGADFNGMVLSNGVADAVNDIEVTAGSRLAKDGSMVLFNGATLIKRLDANFAVGNGAGGRNPGESVADGTWHVHAIGRNKGYNCEVIFSQSMTPTLPTGWTASRYLGSFMRVSGTNVLFKQSGRRFDRSAYITSYAGQPANTNAFTITLDVPIGAPMEAIFNLALFNGSGAQQYLSVSALHQTDVAADIGHCQIAAPDGAYAVAPCVIVTNTSAQIRGRINVTGGFTVVSVNVTGWYAPIDQML
jgi:hypothetical protein